MAQHPDVLDPRRRRDWVDDRLFPGQGGRGPARRDFRQGRFWARGVLGWRRHFTARESDRAAHALRPARARSADLFPSLSAELRERTAIDNGYLRCGGLDFDAGDDWAAWSAVAWGREGIAHELLDAKACTTGTGPGPFAALRLLLARPGPTSQSPAPQSSRTGVSRARRRITAGLSGSRLPGAAAADPGRSNGVGSVACGALFSWRRRWTDALLQPIGWKPCIQPFAGRLLAAVM